MKKLNEWLMMSLVMVVTLCMSACSSSSDDEPVVPEFPTSKVLNVVANSEQTFTFTANMDWKLSSDKTWCTLSTSAMSGQNISGNTGTQSVKIQISDESLDFSEATANLTLVMGGESQVVAKVVRAAKDYELKVYDSEGKDVTTTGIVIGIDGEFKFSVVANFECAATVPMWLEDVVLTADATGNKLNGTLIVKEGYTKNTIPAENMTFANQLGTASFSVPVSYEGMNPNAIVITSKDIESGSFWNWNVSLDGKTFTKKNDLTSTVNEIKEKMTFNIVARNDEYTPIFIEIQENEYLFDATWMHMSHEGEIATFTVDATDKAREGYVLVLPNTFYNSVKDDLKGKLLDKDEDGNTVVKYEYEQTYFLLSFTQEDESISNSMKVLQQNYLDIACTLETDVDVLEYLQSEYSLKSSDISTISVAANIPLSVYPNLSTEEWDASNTNACFAVTLDGKSIDSSELGGFEGAYAEDGSQYVTFKTPASFTQAIVIVFKGIDYLNKKALIIRPV